MSADFYSLLSGCIIAQPQPDEKEEDQLRGEKEGKQDQDHQRGEKEEGGECWSFHSLLNGCIDLLLHSSITYGCRERSPTER